MQLFKTYTYYMQVCMLYSLWADISLVFLEIGGALGFRLFYLL